MEMETAAAILTKLAFEQNSELKSQLTAVEGRDYNAVALIMSLFRQIYFELEKDLEDRRRFPSPLEATS